MTIHEVFSSRLSLHNALGVPKGKRIPIHKLEWAKRHLPRTLRAKAALVLRLRYHR